MRDLTFRSQKLVVRIGWNQTFDEIRTPTVSFFFVSRMTHFKSLRLERIKIDRGWILWIVGIIFSHQIVKRQKNENYSNSLKSYPFQFVLPFSDLLLGSNNGQLVCRSDFFLRRQGLSLWSVRVAGSGSRGRRGYSGARRWRRRRCGPESFRRLKWKSGKTFKWPHLFMTKLI